MNRRSIAFVAVALLLIAGTLCGELTRGALAQVVAPALLLLGVVGLSYLSLTSNQPAGGAESTSRVASSR